MFNVQKGAWWVSIIWLLEQDKCMQGLDANVLLRCIGIPIWYNHDYLTNIRKFDELKIEMLFFGCESLR